MSVSSLSPTTSISSDTSSSSDISTSSRARNSKFAMTAASESSIIASVTEDGFLAGPQQRPHPVRAYVQDCVGVANLLQILAQQQPALPPGTPRIAKIILTRSNCRVYAATAERIHQKDRYRRRPMVWLNNVG
uniref:Uncharacterized protein n=1 Tax=Anopheles merus TaxID=30066 RepID=A0A182UPZ2_ANOME